MRWGRSRGKGGMEGAVKGAVQRYRVGIRSEGVMQLLGNRR